MSDCENRKELKENLLYYEKSPNFGRMYYN